MKGVLPDHWIHAHADEIFVNGTFCETTREVWKFDGSEGATKVISFGLSSFGYDLRIDQKFKVFSPVSCQAIDPKNFNEACFEDVDTQGQPLLIPPNSFVLGQSMEELQIPDDVLCLVIGKSTYARCGIIVNVTPLEPGWRGHVTIEITNTAPLPARIYPGEGICQVIFFRGADKPTCSYTTKPGGSKYQDQKEITLPKV